MTSSSSKTPWTIVFGVVALVGAILTILLFGIPGHASAPETQYTNQCVTVTHGVTTDIGVVPAATVELVENGVKISTPDTPAKANWKSGAVDVKLSDLTDAEYYTYKHDSAAPAALPAFHLYLKTTDGKLATIVSEPYYQDGVGNPSQNVWKVWDVLNDKWWTSSSSLSGVTPEGGGSYAGNKTLAYIIEKNPGVKVVAYGWGQGTYNAGTVATLNSVKFDAKGVSCALHKWSTKYKPSPSPSVSKSASTSASPSPSVTKTAGGTATATTTESTSAAPSLPVTGPGITGTFVLVGLGLLTAGTAGILVSRWHRRSDLKFVA